MSSRLLLSFYGDDFTGSADAMEALCLGGLRCVLFLAPPTPEQLREWFADVRAVGVAGASRAMTPAQMDATLPDVFAQIKRLDAALFHYKVCSTFDSSPERGSIGRALDIGRQVFQSRFVPLLVGAPVLKRYCLFGNLFATFGAETFRLDRHPMMRCHPVTPMHESDLRVHLAAQTKAKIALLDILNLTGTRAAVDANFARVLAEQPDAVLFDVLDEARLTEAGRLIWSACNGETLFAIGSSGLEYALAAHWRETGTIAAEASYPSAGEVKQLLVMSGSCSAATQQQIAWASAHDFTAIALDAVRLMDNDAAEQAREEAKRTALAALSKGESVLLYSAQGPEDGRIATALAAMKARGVDEQTARERLGTQQGMLLRELLLETRLPRICIAGGDTSSYVVQQLGIYALALRTPMAPGSPLCRAYAHDAALDGLEIAMKGGQHGKLEYFGCVRRGAYE